MKIPAPVLVLAMLPPAAAIVSSENFAQLGGSPRAGDRVIICGAGPVEPQQTVKVHLL